MWRYQRSGCIEIEQHLHLQEQLAGRGGCCNQRRAVAGQYRFQVGGIHFRQFTGIHLDARALQLRTGECSLRFSQFDLFAGKQHLEVGYGHIQGNIIASLFSTPSDVASSVSSRAATEFFRLNQLNKSMLDCSDMLLKV